MAAPGAAQSLRGIPADFAARGTGTERAAAVEFGGDWRLGALFAIGLLISIVMLVRSQVGGDQLNLLARGWLLAEQGVWVHYGNPTSAGGKEPGGLTSVLVGVPLMMWSDYRSPVAVIVLFHVIAYALLDRVMRDAGGDRLRLIFCALYWLNPWRLYASGFLWNPNYLFLFSAVHLWSAYRSRLRPSFGLSCVHAGAIGFACQLHPSAIVLAIGSALLLWGRRVQINWAGALCGIGLVAASLIPYAATAWEDPTILPGETGFLGRGLLYVHPLLKGLSMWFRFPSLSLSEKLLHFDFAPLFGSVIARPLEIGLLVLQYMVAPITIGVVILANRWLAVRVRRRRGRSWLRHRHWLQGYAAYMFGAAAIAYALSPTTVMPWQCFSVMHAAVLPLALWTFALSHSRLKDRVYRVAVWWTAVALVFALASAFGSPLYRRTGRHAKAVPLADHPMLYDLGLAGQSDLALGVRDGCKSDVLTSR